MKHNVLIKNVQSNSHAASVLLHQVYEQMERRAWSKARDAFLTEELEKHGTLRCHYCGRSGLKRKCGSMKDRATVDHVQATSKGGDMFDHKNFRVCCDSCNRKKSNSPVEIFEASKYLTNKKKSIA
jgi:5-methylcytosine-specific restriction endonuclease McrA